MEILIKTENFFIRPFDINDVDDVYTSWGKDEKMYNNLTLSYPSSKSEMKSNLGWWIDAYDLDSYNWCFSIVKDNHSIGFIRMYDYKNIAGGIVNVECGLSSSEWNKGYMSECLLSFMKHILLKFKINRIEARCDLENKSIIRVLEKCGMVKEGVSRSSGENNSKKLYDEVVFSLLRKDI